MYQCSRRVILVTQVNTTLFFYGFSAAAVLQTDIKG